MSYLIKLHCNFNEETFWVGTRNCQQRFFRKVMTICTQNVDQKMTLWWLWCDWEKLRLHFLFTDLSQHFRIYLVAFAHEFCIHGYGINLLKACCVHYFLSFFIFSPIDSPLKTVKNVLFHLKSSFRSPGIHIFVIFPLSTLSRFKKTSGSGVMYDVMNWLA